MSRPPRKVDPTVYPCDTCQKKSCPSTRCPQWWPNFLERWGRINAYAILHGVKPICPEMTENPCDKCAANGDCNTICAARAHWWDARMEWLRGVWGM